MYTHTHRHRVSKIKPQSFSHNFITYRYWPIFDIFCRHRPRETCNKDHGSSQTLATTLWKHENVTKLVALCPGVLSCWKMHLGLLNSTAHRNVNRRTEKTGKLMFLCMHSNAKDNPKKQPKRCKIANISLAT